MFDRYSKKVLIPLFLLAYLWLSSIVFTYLNHATMAHRLAMPYDTAWLLLQDPQPVVLKRVGLAHLIALLPLVLLLFNRKEKSLHGNARFAYLQEVKRKYKDKGVGLFLAKLEGYNIIIDGPYHLLIVAETRSGKGVSFVMPIFYSWPGSIISIDMKVENYQITAGFRKQHGQAVYCLNFMADDRHSDCFNVFDYMPEDKAVRISFVQQISNFLSPTPPGADPIWTAEARKLFEGLVLMAADVEALDLSFGQIYRMLHTEQPTHLYLKDMIEEHNSYLDAVCKMNLFGFINTVDKTRSGIKSQLTSTLNVFSNPIVDAATANSSFDIRDVKYKKMSIYVVIPPKYLITLAPMINLFFQMSIDLNLEKTIEQDARYKHSCLLMMDEFTSVGFMETVASKIEYVAGYGLQFALITQSTAQLRAVYKEYAEHIEDNCILKGFLTPNSMKTAKELSERLGTVTVKHKSVSQSYMGLLPNTETITEVMRPLMLPQEILDMPDDKCLLFLKGVKPILAKRTFYYKDPLFKKNRVAPPAIPKLLLQAHKATETTTMKPVDIDIDNIHIEGIDIDKVLNDDEIIDAANQYLAALGEM